MAAAVSSASAQRFTTDETRFTARWTGLTFVGAEFFNITCPVTLEGSFHSATITKTPNALIGFVSRASVATASCTGGRATILAASLPWHVRYRNFTGALPNITAIGVSLVNASFAIQDNFFGFNCLARSTAENPANGEINRNAATGAVTGLRANETPAIPTSGASCPTTTGRFSGTGTVTRLGSTGTITVRLI